MFEEIVNLIELIQRFNKGEQVVFPGNTFLEYLKDEVNDSLRSGQNKRSTLYTISEGAEKSCGVASVKS